MSDEKVENAATLVKEGDELEAKILNIDKKNRTVSLSVKAKDAQEQADVIKKYSRGTEAPANTLGGTTTLGDLLKEKMANKDSEQ